MKHIRILALILALLFCLTACGSSGNSNGDEIILDTDSETDSETVTDSDEETETTTEIASEVPEEAIADVVSYLTDGAYTADSVIATVGDIEVTAAEALYWAYYQESYVNYLYYYYYGVIYPMSTEGSDGTTLGDSVFSSAMEYALVYAVTSAKASELGITIDEETIAEIEAAHDSSVTYYGQTLWDNYVSDGSISEDDYTEDEMNAWIAEKGEEYYRNLFIYDSTTESAYANICSNASLYSALQSALFDDGGEYAPTDETLQDYISDNGMLWARCILFSTTDCEDDDAVAEVYATAISVMSELLTLSGSELSERFTELQSEYDTSGYTAGEIQQYAESDSSSYVDGYISTICSLEAGSVAITDETYYGYFIILREDADLDSVKEDYIESAYSSLIDQWIEEYGVTVSMPELDVQSYFDKLDTLQEIIYYLDYLD